jgi:hypothetical protein
VPDPTSYALWLWLFTALFFLRVVGQVVVVLFHPRWLPPMPQWYSGLMPYRYLLPAQILILALMVAIDLGFSAGSGVFVAPRPVLGRWLVGLSFVYWAGMALRYVLRMRRHPDQRWLGGTIPIVFHCVLAAFLFTFGRYHVG